MTNKNGYFLTKTTPLQGVIEKYIEGVGENGIPYLKAEKEIVDLGSISREFFVENDLKKKGKEKVKENDLKKQDKEKGKEKGKENDLKKQDKEKGKEKDGYFVTIERPIKAVTTKYVQKIDEESGVPFLIEKRSIKKIGKSVPVTFFPEDYLREKPAMIDKEFCIKIKLDKDNLVMTTKREGLAKTMFVTNMVGDPNVRLNLYEHGEKFYKNDELLVKNVRSKKLNEQSNENNKQSNENQTGIGR